MTGTGDAGAAGIKSRGKIVKAEAFRFIKSTTTESTSSKLSDTGIR
jgi:hypothetical protein